MIINEISKGITHIEDLSYSDIIHVASNLADYQITEKVDGAQLLFGIDKYGFYTSRETKGGDRVYNEADYGMEFPSTYKRSAHKLLEQMLPALRSAGLRPGDQVEAEVLYGQVPNVVPYSADTNYLIFLRTTEGTVCIDELKRKIDGQAVSVALTVPYTNDGKNVGLREQINNWKFARVPVIEGRFEYRHIKSVATEMAKFLNKVDPSSGQTLLSLSVTPLNRIPAWASASDWKTVKEHIREIRETVSTTVGHKYIFPLKELLLNQLVRNAHSSFGPLREDGGWIEGVVLRHKTSGKMLKIVDKDVFGTIREAAWQKRNSLTEAAKGVGSCTSFMGDLFLDMARALGHPELGTIQAKNYLRKAGNITEDRIKTLSSDTDFDSVKSYWVSLLDIRESDLGIDLERYLAEPSTNDTAITEAVRHRTLETFALSFGKIRNLRENTVASVDVGGLFLVLVGKQLGEI